MDYMFLFKYYNEKLYTHIHLEDTKHIFIKLLNKIIHRMFNLGHLKKTYKNIPNYKHVSLLVTCNKVKFRGEK